MMDFTEVSTRKRKRRISDNRTKLPSHDQKIIEKLFEKKFIYEKRDDYKLIRKFDGKQLNGKWEIQDFISMKNNLNTLKNELNDKDMITWHEHTRLVNLAGNIALEIRNRLRPELCTQAWCKFYEIASTYLNLADNESLASVHLCEAPGAFITSLNHYLFTQGYHGNWQWLATTLNPYYEGNNIGQMIDEDKFIRCSYGNWYFGEDNTGNLMSEVNLQGLEERLKDVKVDLVTADGSIDCQGEPAEQENVVSRLQHCEVLTALHILSPGGTLVVKMFTLFECKAVGLMYLLNCVFEKVEVFKPCTSKGGNSEVYVIGLNYKGRECCDDFLQNVTPIYFGSSEVDGCLFSQDEIPPSFLEQHTQCVQFFKDCQMTTIQRNLDLLKVMNEEKRSKVEEQKDFCMECFFNQYDMKPLPYSARIMNTSKGRKQGANRTQEFAAKVKLEGKFTGSFCERQELLRLPWQQKLQNIETYEDEVIREDNSLWIQSQAGEITEQELETFQIVRGKPVDSIQSSRFCHGFYLGQVQEIIQNSKWLSTQNVQDPEFVTLVACKLRQLLAETMKYFKDETKLELETLPIPTQDLKDIENIDGSEKESFDNLEFDKEKQSERAVLNEQSELCNEKKSLEREHHCFCTSKGCKLIDSSDVKLRGKEECDCNKDDKLCNESGDLCNSVDKDSDSIGRAGVINTIKGDSTSKISDKTSDINGEIGDNLEYTGNDASEISQASVNVGGITSDPVDDKGDKSTTTTDVMKESNDNANNKEAVYKMDTGEETPLKLENDSETVGQDGTEFTCSCIIKGSPILEELPHQGNTGGINVRLYSVSTDSVSDRFELLEQKSLLSVVRDIQKNCKKLDYVVIEMGTCLSRFTAGLVYILYRSFREVPTK